MTKLMTEELTEADEKLLQEQARIEHNKGPRNPTRAQQYYQPAPPTAEEIAWQEAQAKRQEAAKRPTPLPPRREPDFLEEQQRQLIEERRKERIKAATGGRLR